MTTTDITTTTTITASTANQLHIDAQVFITICSHMISSTLYYFVCVYMDITILHTY